MARRASSSLNPTVIVGSAIALIAIVIGGKSLLGKKSVSFGDVPKLEITEFLDNGNSLRGNEYTVQGTIDEKLQWTTDRGQLISLRIDREGSDEFIAIQIPPDLKTKNVEMHQKYAFRIKINQGGIAIATGIERL